MVPQSIMPNGMMYCGTTWSSCEACGPRGYGTCTPAGLRQLVFAARSTINADGASSSEYHMVRSPSTTSPSHATPNGRSRLDHVVLEYYEVVLRQCTLRQRGLPANTVSIPPASTAPEHVDIYRCPTCSVLVLVGGIHTVLAGCPRCLSVQLA